MRRSLAHPSHNFNVVFFLQNRVGKMARYVVVLAGNWRVVKSSADEHSTRSIENTYGDRRLQIVPPITKVLACGDEGIGAMAEVSEIVNHIIGLIVR